MDSYFFYFDVANTLLYKKGQYEVIQNILKEQDHIIDIQKIMKMHISLCEQTIIPTHTDLSFYSSFNKKLLSALNIDPTDRLIKKIYVEIKKLDWVPFTDTSYLSIFKHKGIISNWDKSLLGKIDVFFANQFDPIVVSSDIGISKPDIAIYHHAINKVEFDPERIIYLGDSITLDINPAKMVGIRAILVDRENMFGNYKGERITSFSELSRIIV